jgi:ATP-binding cassette, subfamily B, bacterial MsbA
VAKPLRDEPDHYREIPRREFCLAGIRLLGRHWALALGTVLSLMSVGLLETYPVHFVRQALELMFSDAPEATRSLAFAIGGWYVCVVLAAGMGLVVSACSSQLGARIVRDLRQQTYDHVQLLSARFLEDQRRGDILNRVLDDISQIRHAVVSPLIWLGQSVATFGFAIVFLWQISWELTLLCLPIGGVLVATLYVWGRVCRPLWRESRKAMADLWGTFAENLAGMREIQVFGREAYESERIRDANRRVETLEVRSTLLWQVSETAFGILFPLATVVILWHGGLLVRTQELSIADLSAFLLYAGLLIRPLRGTAGHYAGIQRALISAGRLAAVLRRDAPVEDLPAARPLSLVRGRIRFENVAFAYETGRSILHDFTLEIAPGEVVALVGKTGAGKTTVIKLLLRFYDPLHGTIWIDDSPLKQATLRSLRKHVGVVFQDPYLFAKSLWDNIAFGDPAAGPDAIRAAARAADVDEFAGDLPLGYDTPIGEGGVKLSQGQRQRVAIARAMLHDPRILILDEATSALDAASEERVQAAMWRLLRDRTCLIIAHRLSSIRGADRIVVLDGGRIVEEGSYASLMGRAGAFARLYEAQRWTADAGDGQPASGRVGTR